MTKYIAGIALDPNKCQWVVNYGRPEARQCNAYPVYGQTMCTAHNGGSPNLGFPSGHTQFNHGATSKFLSTRLAGKKIMQGRHSGSIKSSKLAAKYLEARNDPEIIAMTDDLALVDMRIGQLLERWQEGDMPPSQWNAMIDDFKELDSALKRYDSEGSKTYLRRMRKTLLEDRLSDREIWDEIKSLMKLRRELAEGERRRRTDMAMLLTAEQAMDSVANILAAIHEATERILDEGTSKRVYLAIAHRVAKLTGSGDREVIEEVRGTRL